MALRNILTIIGENYSWVHGRQIIVKPFQNKPAITSSKMRWKVGIASHILSLGSQFVFVTKGISLHSDSRQDFKV